MKKLNRYHVLTVVMVVALLTVGGALVASNMGFKLVDTRTFNGAGQNIFNVSIPHNSSYATSDVMLTDLFDGTNTLTAIRYDNSIPGPVQQSIEYYCSTTSSCWTQFNGPNFALSPGQGVQLQITATQTTTIVGSQDPSFTHPALTFNGSGQNLFDTSLTPNTKWSSSSDVLAGWFDGTNVLTVIRYDNTIPGPVQQSIEYYCSTTSSCWTQYNGAPFSLAPGEGFQVQIVANLGARAQEPYY